MTDAEKLALVEKAEKQAIRQLELAVDCGGPVYSSVAASLFTAASLLRERVPRSTLSEGNISVDEDLYHAYVAFYAKASTLRAQGIPILNLDSGLRSLSAKIESIRRGEVW